MTTDQAAEPPSAAQQAREPVAPQDDLPGWDFPPVSGALAAAIAKGDELGKAIQDFGWRCAETARASSTPDQVKDLTDVRDAERYRWLRNTFDSLDAVMLRKSTDGPTWRSGTDLDEAIDAALIASRTHDRSGT